MKPIHAVFGLFLIAILGLVVANQAKLFDLEKKIQSTAQQTTASTQQVAAAAQQLQTLAQQSQMATQNMQSLFQESTLRKLVRDEVWASLEEHTDPDFLARWEPPPPVKCALVDKPVATVDQMVTDKDHIEGNPHSKVTLFEFSDLQ